MRSRVVTSLLSVFVAVAICFTVSMTPVRASNDVANSYALTLATTLAGLGYVVVASNATEAVGVAAITELVRSAISAGYLAFASAGEAIAAFGAAVVANAGTIVLVGAALVIVVGLIYGTFWFIRNPHSWQKTINSLILTSFHLWASLNLYFNFLFSIS